MLESVYLKPNFCEAGEGFGGGGELIGEGGGIGAGFFLEFEGEGKIGACGGGFE